MAAQGEIVGKAKGQLRRGLESNPRENTDPPTLAEAGIDKNLAHRARKRGLAARQLWVGRTVGSRLHAKPRGSSATGERSLCVGLLQPAFPRRDTENKLGRLQVFWSGFRVSGFGGLGRILIVAWCVATSPLALVISYTIWSVSAAVVAV